MQFVFDETQLLHRPTNFLVRGRPKPVPEVPARAEILRDAALAAGHRLVRPATDSTKLRARIHSAEYLAFLETAWARWQKLPDAANEVIPNVHPDRRDAPYPRAVVGQAGYHMADTAAPLARDSWPAICASADSAAHAAALVLDGAGSVYALCRPPGHHAFAGRAGGFCYLNNSAIAAEKLREAHARVAILDVDLHHGNGTQGIFYRRGDVLTLSIHADPADFYPFFWGYAAERGEGGARIAIAIFRCRSAAAMRPFLRHSTARLRFCAHTNRTRWSSPSGSMRTSAILLRRSPSPRQDLARSAGVSQRSICRPCWCRRAVTCRRNWARAWSPSSPDFSHNSARIVGACPDIASAPSIQDENSTDRDSRDDGAPSVGCIAGPCRRSVQLRHAASRRALSVQFDIAGPPARTTGRFIVGACACRGFGPARGHRRAGSSRAALWRCGRFRGPHHLRPRRAELQHRRSVSDWPDRATCLRWWPSLVPAPARG
jgi:acetoin utilization deacetylase AcuC-like enzyme